MANLTDWLQSNWYEFGSLLIQFAILVTLASLGRGILRILRLSHGLDELSARPELSHAAAAEHSGGMGSAWNGVVMWLQTPMGSGGVGSFRRMIRWFQAPMGS